MQIASNGIRIHVEAQDGPEPALVFLHYWGGSARTWRHVTGALAGTCRTIAIDHRGWGHSEAPAAGYSLADLAADALGVIRALGLKRHVLVGHSMGGKVAQMIAAGRPAGLAGLVLVAPAPPAPMQLPEAARETMIHAYETRASVEAVLDHVLTASPLAAADRAQAIADSLRGAPEARRAWPAAASREDIRAEVGAIDVPVLVVAGAVDRVESVQTLKAELLPHLPQAVLQIVPGAGHLLPLEAPDALVRLIDGFLRSLD